MKTIVQPLIDGQYVEFQTAVLKQLPRDIPTEVLEGWCKNQASLKRVLAEALLPPEVTVGSPKQEVVDNIIRVDRSKKVVYPDWVKGVLHPELECTGPAEYVIDEGRSLYLHPKQKEGGWIMGSDLHKYLVDTKVIGNCAGYADLVEIQKKGIAFFRKHFKDKAVFGWKSVVRDAVGYLYVPYLYGDGDEVVQGWGVLGDGWDQSSPALRVA